MNKYQYSPISNLRLLDLKKLLFLCLFFLSFLSLQAQWLDWQEATSSRLELTTVANSDGEEKDMSPADLNNDGLTDLIVVRKEPFSSSTQPSKSDLLLMNVDGVLTDQTSTYAPEFLSNPSFARDLFIGDFDDDGWQDVIIANTFDQQPIYYRNRGNDTNGNWLGLIDESASRFPVLTEDEVLLCAVWGGDLTGNGAMDIYMVNYKQNSAGGIAKDFLLINDGAGYFTNETQSRVGDFRNSAFGTSVEIHDIDNDGDNDIIKNSVLYSVPPWNQQGLFILYNNGSGNFTNYQKISNSPFGADAPYMFRVEDFNQDGMLDVFVVDDGVDYQLTASSINANSFISYNVVPLNASGTNSFGGNIHSTDLDLDGDIDIAVADVDVDIPPCNSSRYFSIFENVNGVLTNTYNGANPWNTNTYDFSFLDINDDGLDDFVLGLCSGYSVFMNDNCELVTNAADYDLDGISDACDDCPTNPDPNCIPDPTFPTVDPNLDIARQWNELLLESIRKDFARPTVHARNLFHTSIAMWDAWAAYNPAAGCTYLLGQTIEGFTCSFNGVPVPIDLEAAREEAISFAAYRILSHRFANSPEVTVLQNAYDNHMAVLGYNTAVTSTDYSTGSSAALGNYIAQCVISFGMLDGANEQNAYENTAYTPVNGPLVIDNPGNPDISDYNRWQPLTLDLFIDQSGNVIPGATPDFLSPEWGQVTPFALEASDLTTYNRDGFNYEVYHDPGAPPYMDLNGGAQTNDYQWNFATVLTWSSHLDPTDGVMQDISPGVVGNSPTFPTSYTGYPSFYNQLSGGTSATGHAVNPTTGQAYAANLVPRGDFSRVLAEFWADGPDSETPPGHWFTLLNYVADHPDFEKRYEGQGPILNETEWYVKSYLTMGGAMHDAAVTAWGIKGWYDYLRPISAIRAMADLGQSSNPLGASYHPAGLPLIPGYIEMVTLNDPLAGAGNVNVNKIKVKAWKGHDAINNVDTDEAGVDWILAEDWVPYQRPSFVTPPFAGYVSGHSTYSRAAAEVLTLLTGDAYFPGGLGTFTATKDEFLVFEDGPSVDVELQWATYRDAADQSALSRIWGGIHPPADDIPGRIIGEQIGIDAYAKAKTYFTGQSSTCVDDCEFPSNIAATVIGGHVVRLDWDDVANPIDKYRVQIRVQGDPWPSGDLNAPTSYRFINGLTSNTTYQCRVKTNCLDGKVSVWSNPITFTTSADACDRPLATSASGITATSATINWSSIPDASKYKIFYKEAGQSWITIYVNAPTASYNLSGLLSNQKYFYKVKTKCPFGWTNWYPKDQFITSASFTNDMQSRSTIDVQAIQLFPNPATEQLNIQLGEQKTEVIYIVNLNGQRLKTIGASSGQLQLDIEDLATGTYFVNIILENQEILTKKFVKL